ncbi:type I polyketide synthase [Oceaniovalibus sp. ACAM 378]|uniref:type I polyketide synthase n=1 Tax=Oceaniovalibus sp. ACAM 378 TaxID=2599923 RepID=UPI0011D89BBD|nr:type I polyketide synthase [Oceaniovalibus sp. ACAM 378]TYB85037.1 SDR family NAD(P)-dependent oxidoreductase [Oceaniovalibus sp. ACAM 378]
MTKASTISSGELSPIKRAFLALDEAQSKLARIETAAREPIAIIGLGCRVPGGGDSPGQFWQLLRDGTDAISEVPEGRWNHSTHYNPDPAAVGKISTRHGGFLASVDGFDPEFFGISPREAQGLDPQHRLMLEVCWETLENAGQAPDSLVGSATGVFVGAAGNDYSYEQLKTRDPALLDAHFASGIAHSTLSGRLSYILGLQGPSVTIDTACSSSLVAVHMACQALRTGDCRMALAGGVNLILGPDIFTALSQARMLAPDGRCKAFGADADGFGRAEGCAVVALKRLSDAQHDGDRIIAQILGSAVNQDGASGGLTAPNGPAQEAVIRSALKRAGVTPEDVGYVETHGTGTSLGDPIEASALAGVFAKRPGTEPLLIGSVKSNLGHLEAASGAIGLIKLALSLQHGHIPASLHAAEPSPLIDWSNMPLAVTSTACGWPTRNGRRIGGVSSFGFSGTNAHLVLEAPTPDPAERSDTTRQPMILALSAAGSGAALTELAAAYARTLADPTTNPGDFCHTATAGRAQLGARATVIGADRAALCKGLEALAEGYSAPGIAGPAFVRRDPPRTAFLFTGQGAQYAGMGKGLYETEPVFREVIDRCAAELEGELQVPLTEILFDQTDDDRINRTGNAQPALFALEYALAQLWGAYGVRPDIVAGHSLGEIVAATLAGVFSLEDALQLVSARGRLMQALPAGGAMASIFAPEKTVQDTLRALNSGAVIAGVNSAVQTVISGPAEDIAIACDRFDTAGIASRPLAVSHAFHSPLMEPALDAFEALIAKIPMQRPRIRLMSNVTGKPSTDEIATPRYWRQHLREAVRFGDCLNSIAALKPGLIIEIGPHGALLPLAKEVFSDDSTTLTGTLRRGTDDRAALMAAVSTVWRAGVSIDWRAVSGPDRRIADVPTYPFQRDRHWFRATRPRTNDDTEQVHPLLGTKLRVALENHTVFEQRLLAGDRDHIADHVVQGRCIVPGAAMIEMAISAVRLVLPGLHSLGDLTLIDPLVLDDRTETLIQTIVTCNKDSESVEILSWAGETGLWRRHATALVLSEIPTAKEDLKPEDFSAQTEYKDAATHYADLAARGFRFGPSLQRIEKIIRVGENEAVGQITARETQDRYFFDPAQLDGCLQVIAAALPEQTAEAVAYLPFAMGNVTILRSPGPGLRARAKTVPAGSAGDRTLRASVTITDDAGLVAVLSDIILREARQTPPNAFYTVDWSTIRSLAPLPAPDTLVFEARQTLDTLAKEYDLVGYDAANTALDAVTVEWISKCFLTLGWTKVIGDAVEVNSLAHRFGIPERLWGLLTRFLNILAEDGILSREGQSWTVISELPQPDPVRMSKAVAERHPQARAKLQLMDKCGPNLPQILRGTRNPVEDLFPDGDLSNARALYRDSSESRTFNGAIAETVRRLCKARTDSVGPLRILEIGGGSGGTTATVLSRLDGLDFSYVFTDIGTAMVRNAEAEFGNRDGLSFRTLDIEKDPTEQGFARQGYDLVIAANVLHATTDLRATVTRVQEMLAPGGLMLLLEVVAPERWVDLSFGLTKGWWLFADKDLRPEYPLIGPSAWIELLRGCGLEAENLSGNNPLSRQVIFAARKPTATDGVTEATWIVIADDAETARAADVLTAAGINVDLRTSSAEWLADFSGAPDGILDLRPLGADMARGGPEPVLSALRETVQNLLRQKLEGEMPRLVVATCQSQKVACGDRPDPAQAAVWGMMRALRAEFPDLRATSLDLPRGADGQPVLDALASLLTGPQNEAEIALRDETRFAARLAATDLAQPETHAVALEKSSDGVLGNLRLVPLNDLQPGPDEVLIDVIAAGLNLRDVMNALNMRNDTEPLGGECVGIVRAVGADVHGLQPGDRVVGIATGCFATRAIGRDAELFLLPTGISPAEAATLPFAFMTAQHALIDIGEMRRGEWVLIHAAAGGVGSAAVQIAQAAGARIIATAGSKAKRQRLRAAGIQHVYSSRDIEFAEMAMTATGGKGVDLALNSLAGEFIDATVACLAPTGRLVEIGKRDLWTPARFAEHRPEGSYQIVDLAAIRAESPEVSDALFLQVMEAARGGKIRPLPVTTFPLNHASEAFEFMAQARHIGKIVLLPTPTETHSFANLRADASYLITGGTRGLGLETAREMVRGGARTLVLVARSAPDAATVTVLSELRAQGVRIETRQIDVSDRAAVADLFAQIVRDLPPLRGIVHSAGQLSDASILRMSRAEFAVPLGAKVDGSWNLHLESLSLGLDFFVLYSSVAGTLGSAGQTNHAAANAFMDALAQHRQALGLPAISIAWGAWSEAGIAAETAADVMAGNKGIRPITNAAGLAMAQKAMESRQAHVVACPIDWTRFRAQRPDMIGHAFLERMTETTPDTARTERRLPPPRIFDTLAAATGTARRAIMLDFVADQVASTLDLATSEDIDLDRPLRDLGLDSLMAVDLRNKLSAGLGGKLNLPTTMVFEHPTVAALTDGLLTRITTVLADEPAPDHSEATNLDTLETLSEDEIEALFARATGGS